MAAGGVMELAPDTALLAPVVVVLAVVVVAAVRFWRA
jgi:hypothetical protein